jgi:hypothetical protein
MAGTSPRFDLRLWSVATFRLVTFVVALALFVHLRGLLRGTLSSLDTTTGFGFFLLLWVTTCLATVQGVRYRQRARHNGDGRGGESDLASTIVAGGWNGAYVFLILIVSLALASVASRAAGGAAIGFVLASIAGTLIAFVIGGLVGLIFGLIEALLFAVSAWIVDDGRLSLKPPC